MNVEITHEKEMKVAEVQITWKWEEIKGKWKEVKGAWKENKRKEIEGYLEP
jgi:uncharacterized protein YjbJ (UPF0337 family)